MICRQCGNEVPSLKEPKISADCSECAVERWVNLGKITEEVGRQWCRCYAAGHKKDKISHDYAPLKELDDYNEIREREEREIEESKKKFEENKAKYEKEKFEMETKNLDQD